MATSCLAIILFYLVSSALILSAQGVSIQVFEHSNFTELVWESNSTLRCNNLPREQHRYPKSIRTDTCFIVYYDLGCKSWFSEKFLPGDMILTGDPTRTVGAYRSFQICNEHEGGNQLNVDITKMHDLLHHYHLRYWDPENSSHVLESYKNVCSCVNVPHYVQNMSEWSIDNHHNALLAYYERDCLENKWNPTFIKAGHNIYSIVMHQNTKTDSITQKTNHIQSFGPNPNSTYFQTSCSKFHTRHKNKRFQNLSNQISQLQSQVRNLERNQEKLEFEMQDFQILKRNQEKFEFEMQEFRNFTAKLKSNLGKLFS